MSARSSGIKRRYRQSIFLHEPAFGIEVNPRPAKRFRPLFGFGLAAIRPDVVGEDESGPCRYATPRALVRVGPRLSLGGEVRVLRGSTVSGDFLDIDLDYTELCGVVAWSWPAAR